MDAKIGRLLEEITRQIDAMPKSTRHSIPGANAELTVLKEESMGAETWGVVREKFVGDGFDQQTLLIGRMRGGRWRITGYRRDKITSDSRRNVPEELRRELFTKPHKIFRDRPVPEDTLAILLLELQIATPAR